MQFTKCRNCKHEIDTTLEQCPYCGANFPIAKGTGFEWKSKTEILGYPFIHIAFGKDANGRWRVARGIIAIGQFGIGVICFAQIGIGFLFGFGQIMVGFLAIAQLAITAYFAIGQVAVGYYAIGQIAVGSIVMAQVGIGEYVWTPQQQDPEAVNFFRSIMGKFLP